MKKDIDRVPCSSSKLRVLGYIITLSILLTPACIPMKRLDSEVYRPVDYVEAEREAMAAELNATLGDRFDQMSASLEKLENKIAQQDILFSQLSSQYTDLETRYSVLQSEMTKLQSIVTIPPSSSTAPSASSKNNTESVLEKKAAKNRGALLFSNESESDQPKINLLDTTIESKQKRAHLPINERILMGSQHSDLDTLTKKTVDNTSQTDSDTLTVQNQLLGAVTSHEATPDDAERLYKKARALLLENNPEKAEPLFQAIVNDFPDHSLAVNALYWAGECRYSVRDYEGAIRTFKALVESYPNGLKVPDALLKTAYAYLSMDDPDRAHHYLKTVVKQFPFSPAGEKAAEKLNAYQ